MSNSGDEEFGRTKNYNKVLNKWWVEGKQLKSRDTGISPTTNLREPYMYVVALDSRLYMYCIQ